ncbi:MAG: hypothetical protein H7Z42_19315, partial [Roseiflexaceae bacterium]|nr:hypothetical protein [Roseiflexaceae bacterium]
VAARLGLFLDVLVALILVGVVCIDIFVDVVRANGVARQILGEVGLNGQLSLSQLETALVPSDRTLAAVELVALPTFDLATEHSYSHLLIDQREQARLARLRGELLALLTDDMRNPLTSMVTALDLTLGQQHLPDDVDRVLLGARQSGQRLLELVTMLLDISQLEQRSAPLRRTTVALSRVIEAGIAQISPLAQQGAVTVSVEHAGDSMIDLDADRVQRAFCYLLEQALRNSPPYSIVQIRMRRADGQLIVQISDQGAGRTLPQGEQALRQDERGIASLGLAYSRLVIEAHGGRVWAENNDGQGSISSFALPVSQQELLV